MTAEPWIPAEMWVRWASAEDIAVIAERNALVAALWTGSLREPSFIPELPPDRCWRCGREVPAGEFMCEVCQQLAWASAAWSG